MNPSKARSPDSEPNQRGFQPTGMGRRRFLQVMSAGTFYLAATARQRVLAEVEESLPPVRVITRGPKFHWFGYYDKLQFDPTHRYVLGNQVDFEHRSPRPDDVIQVGMVDLQDGDRWIELGESRAWNWQQGCMLQWVPGSESEVLWNDREGDRFVARILDVKTRRKRTLPYPIYCLSPNGRTAVSTDFPRLNDCRPGYGYTGIPDLRRAILAPAESGLWRVDLVSGQRELLFTLAEAARIAHEPDGFNAGSKHWFNHLLFNTDGSRFFFLHRWHAPGDKIGFYTRAFTADEDGGNLYLLDPHGKTSHFIWRDREHIMAWAWHPSHGQKFYLYRDLTDQVEVVASKGMPANGHNTYLPGANNEWVLNDTYPDRQRFQHPYLYHLPTDRKVPLGHFHSPARYRGEWRCDTHPRASRDGRWVCIDAPHKEGRQMHLIDVQAIR